MKKVVTERYDLIMNYEGIEVRDTKHAKEEFHIHFSHLSWQNTYIPKLKKGLKKILKKYGRVEDRYMIISHSTELRIPLHLRPDTSNTTRWIAAVPTTLSPEETYNLHDEIEVFVEKNKSTFKWFPLQESFDYFAQKGKVYKTFVEVDID